MVLLKSNLNESRFYEFFRSLRNNFLEFRKQRSGYKYYLSDVEFFDNYQIKLIVIIQGIKKQIHKFSPEEIVSDDILLSEFSSADVRTITYLSLYKYIVNDNYELLIEKQYLENGTTLFDLKNIQTKQSIVISAKNLYQNYELLTKLNKKDMINAISTAVQEQTMIDISLMN